MPPTTDDDERYEKQLKTALFDAEMDSRSWTSDDMPPELLDQFHAGIREMEARRQAEGTTTVRSLLGDLPILPPDEIADAATAEGEITRLLAALEEKGILTDRPPGFDAPPYYHFLHEVLLEQEVVPPGEGQQLVLPFEEIFRANFDPTELITEAFMLSLFNLDEPFPTELLSSRMRLDDQVVSRARGLKHLNDWRAQFSRIEPITFGFVEVPGAPQLPPGQAVCFFGVEYIAYLKDGSADRRGGRGVLELILEGDDWRVSGGMFVGFAF